MKLLNYIKSLLTSKVQVKVKTLEHFSGDLPKYQTLGSAGMDVRAQLPAGYSVTLEPGKINVIPTGLCFGIPKGYEIQVRSRSGLSVKGIVVGNSPGTVDSDYTGEVKVILFNNSGLSFTVENQDRIAQLVLSKVPQAELVLVDSLEKTKRGSGGFGSTGSK
jgi:dUTP pyrophosphatase